MKRGKGNLLCNVTFNFNKCSSCKSRGVQLRNNLHPTLETHCWLRVIKCKIARESNTLPCNTLLQLAYSTVVRHIFFPSMYQRWCHTQFFTHSVREKTPRGFHGIGCGNQIQFKWDAVYLAEKKILSYFTFYTYCATLSLLFKLFICGSHGISRKAIM